MEFNVVEFLKYCNINGSDAIVVLAAIFFFVFVAWILFSKDRLSEKLRIRVIKLFSSASSTIHIGQERLAEQISADIDQVLSHLRAETEANNALVIRFRNGSYDSMGNSILKFFASNEKAKSGYIQIGEKITNISRSLYGEFCDRLIREHKVYVKNTEAVKNCPELIGVLSLFNNPEKFYARSLITTHDGQIIGFVCLVYTEPHRIAESKIDELLTEACARIVAKIEMGKLTVNKKKKK